MGETSPDNTHHYVCDDNDCTKVRYYYYVKNTTYQYILFQNGETVESALKKMINNEGDATVNINVYNSAIKGYLDNWYTKNLTNFTNYIDTETIYCNDRRTTNLSGTNQIGGFDKSGDLSNANSISFRQTNSNSDLSCGNVTDRFSINNQKAKLTYPVGLLTEVERKLIGNSYASTGKNYWTFTPGRFIVYSGYGAGMVVVFANGGNSGDSGGVNAVRPVISLKPDVTVISGNGGYETPYKIDTSS